MSCPGMEEYRRGTFELWRKKWEWDGGGLLRAGRQVAVVGDVGGVQAVAKETEDLPVSVEVR